MLINLKINDISPCQIDQEKLSFGDTRGITDNDDIGET